MKHILHVIDTTGPGGAETVFVEIADNTRKHGYRSTVLIRGEGWVMDEVKRRNLDVYVLDPKGSFNSSYLRDFISLVRKLDVDLLQSHLLGSNLYCAMVGAVTRKPVIGVFHGGVDVARGERFKRLKFFLMNTFIAKYVAVSRRLLNQLVVDCQLKKDRATVIYNGVDCSRYAVKKDPSLRERLQIPSGSFVFGCLGNLRPAKAYDVMVKALALCIERGEDFQVVVAGDINKKIFSELSDLAESLGVQERIHYVGFTDNSAQYLRGLDAFLLTSLSEGFSISTIEAMLTQLPVIATKCGGPQEIVRHKETGLLVENGCPNAVSEAMRYVVKNRQKSEEMAAEARSDALKRFGIENTISCYEDLYKNILGG